MTRPESGRRGAGGVLDGEGHGRVRGLRQCIHPCAPASTFAYRQATFEHRTHPHDHNHDHNFGDPHPLGPKPANPSETVRISEVVDATQRTRGQATHPLPGPPAHPFPGSPPSGAAVDRLEGDVLFEPLDAVLDAETGVVPPTERSGMV